MPDLKNILLSERNQHMVCFQLYEVSRIGKCRETEGRLVVALEGRIDDDS